MNLNVNQIADWGNNSIWLFGILVWCHGVFGVDCLLVHWFILFLRRRVERDSFSKCQNVLQD